MYTIKHDDEGIVAFMDTLQAAQGYRDDHEDDPIAIWHGEVFLGESAGRSRRRAFEKAREALYTLTDALGGVGLPRDVHEGVSDRVRALYDIIENSEKRRNITKNHTS